MKTHHRWSVRILGLFVAAAMMFETAITPVFAEETPAVEETAITAVSDDETFAAPEAETSDSQSEEAEPDPETDAEQETPESDPETEAVQEETETHPEETPAEPELLTRTENAKAASDAENGEETVLLNEEYVDGTYEGTGNGRNGAITVSVVIENGAIKSIDVLSHQETESYDAFKALVMDDAATVGALKASRSEVARAYTSLVPKTTQTLMVSVKLQSVSYEVLAKSAKTYSLITASGAEGKISYTKTSGTSYITVNSSTGKITVAKGIPAGNYTVKIKVTAAATDDMLEAAESVTVRITVKKAAQPMTVSAKTVKVARKKVVRKKQTVNAVTISNAQGTVTYKKVSGSKKITVNARTGRITVAKRTKRGTYTVTIRVTAAGNQNYEAGTKTVTVKVRVK